MAGPTVRKMSKIFESRASPYRGIERYAGRTVSGCYPITNQNAKRIGSDDGQNIGADSQVRGAIEND
jgi:hypothetical protein